MDEGWIDFVRTIRQENAKSNRRLFKILTIIKGKSFVDSLQKLIKVGGGLPQIRICKHPKGLRMNERRYSGITELWVESYQSAGENKMYGTIYIQVKPDRWICYNF